MSKQNIIRAWKDPGFRNSLSRAELAALPPNPAGAIEISDEDLGKIAGGLPRLSIQYPCPAPTVMGCPINDTSMGTCNAFCNSYLHNC